MYSCQAIHSPSLDYTQWNTVNRFYYNTKLDIPLGRIKAAEARLRLKTKKYKYGRLVMWIAGE